MPFGGDTYSKSLDEERLRGQLTAVKMYLVARTGQWVTLAQIERHLGYPQASISARLRDLRKAKFGAWEIERERVNNSGLHRYRLTGKKVEPERKPCPWCDRMKETIKTLEQELGRCRNENSRRDLLSL